MPENKIDTDLAAEQVGLLFGKVNFAQVHLQIFDVNAFYVEYLHEYYSPMSWIYNRQVGTTQLIIKCSLIDNDRENLS